MRTVHSKHFTALSGETSFVGLSNAPCLGGERGTRRYRGQGKAERRLTAGQTAQK